MARRCHTRKIGLMTGIAIRRRPFEDAIRVTRCTRDRGVSSRQRERCGAVIERGGFPDGRGVTRQTVMRELTADMVRGKDRCEIRLMAGIAIRRRPFEHAVLMT